ncbi:MAG TPA: hypothetical protein PL015_08465 [Opitutaceae bacterium]|nr:hypothetical protein [Opitutaceae bacterium]
MKPSTWQLIEEINGYPLFCEIGKRPLGDKFTFVASWDRAVGYAQERKWINLTYACFNRTSSASSATRGAEWNVFAEKTKVLLKSAEEKISRVFTERNAPWSLASACALDLFLAVAEEEYSDVIRPLFFKPILLPVYAAGHFPCGWNGGTVPGSEIGGTLRSLPPGKIRVH